MIARDNRLRPISRIYLLAVPIVFGTGDHVLTKYYYTGVGFRRLTNLPIRLIHDWHAVKAGNELALIWIVISNPSVSSVTFRVHEDYVRRAVAFNLQVAGTLPLQSIGILNLPAGLPYDLVIDS